MDTGVRLEVSVVRRLERYRIDGFVGIACCNPMDAEHSLGQRISVLSSGEADERVTVK
jgi:hypothetical protein